MDINLRRHRASAAMLLALGALIAVVGSGYGLVTESGAIGPGAMPLLAGSILALGSLQVLLQGPRPDEDAAVSPAAPEQSPTDGSAGEDVGGSTTSGVSRTGVAPMIAIIAIIVCGAVAVPITGFVLASGGIVFTILAVVERVPTWRSAVVALVAGGVLWLLVESLQIPVPSGPLG